MQDDNNKLQNKTHTDGTVPKSIEHLSKQRQTRPQGGKTEKQNKEYRSRGKIDRIFSLIGTDTSISGEVILVVWIQTSLVGK